ncbi:MAG TPA: metallophosphoesterase [Vicinamibacterales bacterium]|nr:metallophosphoesterase [Vicinamibacterales bacterium]
MPRRLAAGLAAALSVCAVCGCSAAPAGPSPTPIEAGAPPVTPSHPPAVLVGSGDIGLCGSPGSELTARLLDHIGGTVFAAGDLAYPSGTAANLQNCYHPSWGRHRSRTMPVPGNHEYESPNAAPYFAYFGPNAGPPGLGYYSYDLGAWHVVALNSEIDIRAGSAQDEWLRADLAAHAVHCTVAYLHRPRFSSGPHGNNPGLHDLWGTLYAFGVDIVLSAHDHLYERFAPQDPAGRADPERGIRQFIVGTGGAALYPPKAIRPNSERTGSEWGVLALTLRSGEYSWEFVPAEGGRFRDAGTGSCH